MTRILMLSLVLVAACLPVPAPKPPVPPPTKHLALSIIDAHGHGISGAQAQIQAGANWIDGTADADGHVVWLVAESLRDTQVTASADGYVSTSVHRAATLSTDEELDAIALAPAIPPLPPVPSRDAITHAVVSMNSLWIDVPGYGRLPWFEGTIASFSPEQRQAIYAAKRANGDTAAIVNVSWNYAEPGQPYGSGNRVPPRDLTGDLPTYRALVEEVIRAGFIPWFYLAGDGESRPDCAYNDPVGWTYGYDCTMQRTLPSVMQALQAEPDLTHYGLWVPGYDAVFYGWEPSNLKVPGFAAGVHQRCPDCLVGIEFNIGHIPVGNGPADYAPGGLMSGYAVLLGEFNVWPSTGDATWQVVARLARPYHRPTDQPIDDDLSPPFYLAHSPIVFHCFEWGTYAHVRNRDVSGGYAYYQALGCPVTEK